MSDQRYGKKEDDTPVPEDIKSEGHGFESQRRQHFSSMKSQLKKSMYPFAVEVVQGACDRCKMYQFILGYMWQMYLLK